MSTLTLFMTKGFQFAVLEDELVDQLVFREYMAAYPALKSCGYFADSSEGLAFIKAHPPDIVFLDIDMPGLTGIDIIAQVKDRVPACVFITSYAEFALDGFKHAALDYILKPLTAERLELCVRKITEYLEIREKATAYEVLVEKESLVIKDGHSHIKLPQHEIIYLEAMQDYTKVVTEHKNYMTLATFTGLLERLPGKKFLRVHRSYAVSVQKVREQHADKLVCGSTAIPIGKTYRSMVSQMKF
ncbi:LytTR family DNA-binding domain-containing protein [Niabella sp.]|uniref:LytR/AlgR family response regulator transcription factor n=1 Tax=Niabella sp. TaxID=1962976 RepID=UPI0026080EF1|nr:LytTR family DNA-binding domain-containing protein [Niabella sp.]